MKNTNRVLAYYKAKLLTNEELAAISGGSLALTFSATQKGTGYYPGTLDVEADQIWD